MKTLTSWENLDLSIYISDMRDGKTTYATFGDRVKEIISSMEVLVDRQIQLASQDGVKIPQSLDIRRTIVGFDFLDIIAPLGAVHSRLHHLGTSQLYQLGSLGAGWTDLVSSIGATIIFG